MGLKRALRGPKRAPKGLQRAKRAPRGPKRGPGGPLEGLMRKAVPGVLGLKRAPRALRGGSPCDGDDGGDDDSPRREGERDRERERYADAWAGGNKAIDMSFWLARKDVKGRSRNAYNSRAYKGGSITLWVWG